MAEAGRRCARTLERRPDLLEQAALDDEERALLTSSRNVEPVERLETTSWTTATDYGTSSVKETEQ